MKYKYEVDVKPTHGDVNRPNLKRFYRFLYARQSIWYNRFVLSLPREEWTDDRILQTTKYTNVFRKLDRGTLWWYRYYGLPFINDIAKSGDTSRELWNNYVWRLCLYRLLNKVETFEKVSLPGWREYKRDGGDKFFSDLQELLDNGIKVWTSAHITLQSNLKATRLENYRSIADKLHSIIPLLCKFIRKCKSAEDMWNRMKCEYGFGPFISYEVVTDLAYLPFTHFDEDEWANAGPGCIPGINLIYPDAKGQKEYLIKMRNLRNIQNPAFETLGLDFKSIAYCGEDLSLRNIEHSLCEWRKYRCQELGVGRPRPKFSPVTNSMEDI